MTALRATARLQLNRDFDFAAAAAQVPYLAALGISHIYMSPIATARPGSTHGYDVIDPMTVNPELGGEAGLTTLVEILHAHDMGAILDIVPNHMAADLANVWWNDVLARGESSHYAAYFDIEWNAPETEGKLWLPWLDVPLGEAIENQRLKIARHIGGTCVGLWLDHSMLPISAAGLEWLFQRAGVTLPAPIQGSDVFDAVRRSMQEASTQAALDYALREVNDDALLMRKFLDRQHYRLAWWRSGDQVLNYRRFFDIHALVALRMERDEVFDAVHALPLRLMESGAIDGLRIDHIDGLSQPGHYLQRLRQRLDQCSQHDLHRRPTVHVEKILIPGESLPRDWPVDGSTGYDFMQQLESLLHDPVGYAILEKAWARLSGRPADFAVEESIARRQLLQTSLVSELSRCVRAFHQFLAATAVHGDITLAALQYALGELLQCMPVYRSYLGDGELNEIDRCMLELAFRHADQAGASHYAAVRALLQRYLLEIDQHTLPPAQAQPLQLFRHRFEQLSTVLSAKAVEDTAFYRYGVLLARNEVGGAPGQKQPEPESFHTAMRYRAIRWPSALLATATHDHKRGEDTRARLDALGEKPRPYVTLVRACSSELRDRTQVPPPVQWMLLQTILAAWPLTLDRNDEPAMRVFACRITEWLRKAQREAKLLTSWISPNPAYEAACERLVEDLLLSEPYINMRQKLCNAARALDAAGALNGLVAVTLRHTAPGVPDLYQGTEYWDQSLVDPDNRRAVDYRARADTLAQTHDPAALLRDYRNGIIKQHWIHRLLQLRKLSPELFAKGSYLPLAVTGARRRHVLAFVRQHGGQRLLVVVPRLCAQYMDKRDLPLVDASFWKNTRVRAADHDVACTYIDLFTYRKHDVQASGWRIAELLSEWPVAVLIPASQTDECQTLPRRTRTPDQ
ncbi:malto-oligosyltrehalose synthase [Dyella flava]|uniref:Malto-oligosyltrehalose synthase n=1 Tax=Dyella flava TaxID=1920170 RepID=A0ABS2K2S1_9GAMM|nr:malto-oligosyltrehalose synthase [Dyella flava]MBM7125068.1 malto-oligosyltrehalose synthase [Dyella flava]GLQ51941.1 malto-oligosyltrehalose synthase [Dyella flava]